MMRRSVFAILLLSLAGLGRAVPARAQCDDPLADPDQVLDLHLRMTRDDWAALRADLDGRADLVEACAASYTWFEGDFRCGAMEEWIRIGVRKKRGEQRDYVRIADRKPPLKLDFNRVVSGQRWPSALGDLGLRRLSLNNGQPDCIEDWPSPPGAVYEYPLLTALLTEPLGWRIMHQEVPAASRAVHARLWRHAAEAPEEEPEFNGVYVVVEDLDRTAIRARFPSDRGRLRKSTDPDCRLETVFDDGPPNSATDAANAWLSEAPTDTPRWLDATRGVLDLEELLRQEAIRDVLANGDDTVLGGGYNNFYEFDPVGGQRHYLPWDLDDVFRPYPQNREPDDPLRGTCASDLRAASVVGARTRCQPEIQQRYYEIVCQLINGALSPDRLVAAFHEADARLRPLIEEEIPWLWAHVADSPLDETRTGTYAEQFERYLDWLPARISSVRDQLRQAGFECALGCPPVEVEACVYLGCASERRCVDGTWTPCLVPTEIPDNGLDDDCNGQVDTEPVAGVPGSAGGAGSDGQAEGIAEAGAYLEGGCGCRTRPTGSPHAKLVAWLGLLALARLSRWRARRQRRRPCPSRVRAPARRSPL